MDPRQVPLGNGMLNGASQALQQRQQMIALQEAAANGDPQAQAMLQQMQAQQGGGQPPMGGGAPPVPADVQAQRARTLIDILRNRGQ